MARPKEKVVPLADYLRNQLIRAEERARVAEADGIAKATEIQSLKERIAYLESEVNMAEARIKGYQEKLILASEFTKGPLVNDGGKPSYEVPA